MLVRIRCAIDGANVLGCMDSGHTGHGQVLRHGHIVIR